MICSWSLRCTEIKYKTASSTFGTYLWQKQVVLFFYLAGEISFRRSVFASAAMGAPRA